MPKEYKAELEKDNYHLRDALQIEEIQDLNKDIEHLENTSNKEIAELKSEISSLKSQLYQAKKDVQNKEQYISTLEERLNDSIPDFLVKLRLYLQNQDVNPADNVGGPPTGREVAIGYLKGCMRGRALEWFDEEITTKQNWKLANLFDNTGQNNLVAVNG
ncbi:1524_t:CDS:2 [Funneliformis geosporum]|uniref:1524_t:CDS:1 n=1 Tax=Funneliformis geosporum TaxID=1117311 RepID=A0A9W4WPB2_9GLOM|nr:1524_t:CDS:2 [Funneliformis geosporum]